MNKHERIAMVKAMEYIVRNLNDEELVMPWLVYGVADGDIEYGDLTQKPDDHEALDYYIEDDKFADLMHTYLGIMKAAWKSGGLCCDGVVDKALGE